MTMRRHIRFSLFLFLDSPGLFSCYADTLEFPMQRPHEGSDYYARLDVKPHVNCDLLI